jgi:GT2 family glycosyltransferase
LDERKDTERFEAPDAGAKLKDVEVELVVLTCGRKEYLQETLASADANLVGSISARTMFDDSADPQFGAWLDGEYGHSWKIVHHDKNLGFTGANGSARKHLVDAGGPEYVFWLEEDFTFRQPVQLDDLANALDAPGLAQVALLRAPYYQREFEAGSIPNEHPESYRQDRFRGVPILRHQRFYTTNPNLSKREMIGKYPWLTGSHSESRYGKGLVADGYDFAFLGHGETWVDHIGKVRKGSGY